MIVGAQKAGTSSLAYYLAQHPDICTHERLELSYFVNDVDFRLGYSANFQRYFAHCPSSALLLGKSVTVMTGAEPIRRMHEHNPAMHVIAILRNPIDRAYSAYWWARRMGYETLETFEEAIDADPGRHHGNIVRIRSTSYISFGQYAKQVEMLHDTFDPERVSIHLVDDLHADALATCRRIFDFVGVDVGFVPDVSGRQNAMSLARSSKIARMLCSQSSLKRSIRRAFPRGLAERWKRRAERWNQVSFEPPPMHPETRARLARYYAPLNAELGELIGRDLSHWGSPQGPQ